MLIDIIKTVSYNIPLLLIFFGIGYYIAGFKYSKIIINKFSSILINWIKLLSILTILLFITYFIAEPIKYLIERDKYIITSWFQLDMVICIAGLFMGIVLKLKKRLSCKQYKNYDIKQHIFYCCLIVIGLNTLYVRYKSPTNEEIERCLSKIDNKDTRPAMVDLNKLSTDMCLRYTPSSR